MPNIISHMKVILGHSAKQNGHRLSRWARTQKDQKRFGKFSARCLDCGVEIFFVAVPGEKLWTGQYKQIPTDWPVIRTCIGNPKCL
jgi:hypothetical protein